MKFVDATPLDLSGILSSIAIGGLWTYKLFNYLPQDAFNAPPDAIVLGYQVGWAPTAWIAKRGSILAAGIAAALAMTSGVGGVDVLLPLHGPAGQAWIYPYGGISINLMPTYYKDVAGGSIAGYAGFVWNVKTPGDYAGPFYSMSGTYRPKWLPKKVPNNATVFAGPSEKICSSGAYGWSLGYGGGTRSNSNGIAVSRTWYLNPSIVNWAPDVTGIGSNLDSLWEYILTN